MINSVTFATMFQNWYLNRGLLLQFCVDLFGREHESAIRRKRVAPRLKMLSKPIKESKLAILGLRNMDDIVSHRVVTMPVETFSAGACLAGEGSHGVNFVQQIGGCLTRTGQEVTTGIAFVNFRNFGHLGRRPGTLMVDNPWC
ncbi:hypothetical protein QYF36_019078 [Acer negundo]|nr:hypothetical protein QYF36_019078 [Acer negundo]